MDGAIWVLILTSLLYAVTVLLHAMIDGRSHALRLPVTWFFGAWIAGLLILTLPIFRYSESFDIQNAAFVIAILLFAATGSLAAAFWDNRRRTVVAVAQLKEDFEADRQLNVSSRVIGLLLVSGLVGTGLLFLNSVLGGDLSLGERLNADNLGAVRLEHMQAAQNRIGMLFGPAALLSSIGGLGVAYLFYLRGAERFAGHCHQWMYIFAVLVLGVNLFTGVIGFGSRMFAVFALLAAFIAYVEGRWSIGARLISARMTVKRLIGTLVASVIAVMMLWFAATYFLEKRVQGQSPSSLLYHTHRAKFDPNLYSLVRNDVASQYFLFSLSYVATPIPTLTFYLDLPAARQPGPFFGEYNFPAIARWGRRLTFSANPVGWEMARFEIFRPLGDIGFGMNVWATLVRDLISDFTKAGALIFVLVWSFVSQRLFKQQLLRPSVRHAGLLVYIRLISGFSGLVGVLFMPQIHWPLYMAAAMVFLWRGERMALPLMSRIAARRRTRSTTSLR